MNKPITQTDMDVLENSVQDILNQLYAVPDQNARALGQLVDELELMARSLQTMIQHTQQAELLLSEEAAERQLAQEDLARLEHDLRFPHRSEDDRVLNAIQKAREAGRLVVVAQLVGYIRALTNCSLQEAEDLLEAMEDWNLSHNFQAQKLLFRLLQQAAGQIARAG